MSNVSPHSLHMSRVRAFQLVVSLSTLLCIVWYFLPYLPLTYLPSDAQSVLQASGAGGFELVRGPWFYNSAFAARLLAGVALFLFLPWARWLLLVVLASDLISVLLAGIAVTAPIDQFVYVLMYLCEGALVAMAYSEPLSHAFVAKTPTTVPDGG